MSSFFSSCFDPNSDSTEAAVSAFKLKLRTGDSHDGTTLSKFFVEAALLFASNQCTGFGFLAGSKDRRFGIRWSVPNSPQADFWGVLDLDSGRFLTSAKNNWARQGFGIAGMGVALATRSLGFRSAWTNFLTELSTSNIDAVNLHNMGWLAAEIGNALEAAAPGSNPANWTLEETALPSTEMGTIETDLRVYMSKADDFLSLCDSFHGPVEFEARFQGPQLRLLRNLIRRRKHTVLLGPPGVGKTVSAFEALALEGHVEAAKDYQLFTGHDEVKSADFLGGWQPSGNPANPYIWVNGCLVRAMIANEGQGQPILVEEFTRMPTRAQNMFISALSDGYVILNEKPNASGDGEIVRAGPNFVLVADMNVDPSADDIELYGAAFSSRVRKLEYNYPSNAALLQILKQDVPEVAKEIRTGIAGVYDIMRRKWEAAEIPQPISPRACVQWAEEIVALIEDRGSKDASTVRSAATQAAEMTWLRDIAGTDAKIRKSIVADIEAQFRKAITKGK